MSKYKTRGKDGGGGGEEERGGVKEGGGGGDRRRKKKGRREEGEGGRGVYVCGIRANLTQSSDVLLVSLCSSGNYIGGRVILDCNKQQ